MTSAAPSYSAATASSDPPSRKQKAWLFGPFVDVSFGYGLAYLLSVPLLVALALLGQGTPAGWVAPALALFISTPHYGATLLRVYERRADRQKYAFFAVWLTLVIVGLFAASLYVAVIGSILLTVYVTWSPWHFSGQNYGIFLMYLRRAGFAPDADLRRPLYGLFICSAVLAILSMHVAAAGWAFAANAYDKSGTFQVLPLGIPVPIAAGAAAAISAAWLGCLVLVLRQLRPALSWRQLGPLAALLAMQALWYLPSLGVLTGVFDANRAGFAFTAIWIATAHAVQYLWVTYYYARREGRHQRFGGFYGKTWLAGSFLMAPVLLLAPGLGGPMAPNTTGVLILTIAVLNIHHFFLDGAIWKLRDGRVARVLLRSGSDVEDEPATTGRRWLRPLPALVWTLAIASLTAQAYAMVLFLNVSRNDVPAPRLTRLAGELAWLGQDTPQLWARVGLALEKAGDDGRAMAAYRVALRRERKPEPWLAKRMAWLLLEHVPDDAGAMERAHGLSRYLVNVLGDSRWEGYEVLAAVHANAGRWDEAARAAETALSIARGQGALREARTIERRLEGYRSGRAAPSDPEVLDTSG